MTLRFHPLRAYSLSALAAIWAFATPGVSAAEFSASLSFGAQDVKAQEERAKGRITEMFCLRLELQLDELAETSGIPLDSLEKAKEEARKTVVAWIDEHPIKLQSQGPISWTSTPIEYTPFREFERSEAWQAARASVLTEPQIALLDARNTERYQAVVSVLSRLVQLRVAEGLCLTEAEQETIAQACSDAGRTLWEDGVIEEFNIYYTNEAPKDALREALDEEQLLAALEPHRRDIVTEMFLKGRSERHSFRLQVEYHLHGMEAVDAQRRLLYGLADAMIHRNGGQEKRESQLFAPPAVVEDPKDWAAAIQGLLKLAEAPEPIEIADKNTWQDLRAEFLLAVLDERACFTADQREGLRPLMKEFVQNEGNRSRRAAPREFVFPRVFGLSEEGLLIPGENDRFGQPSTKVQALIKTFYESCTQAQSDVLKS